MCQTHRIALSFVTLLGLSFPCLTHAAAGAARPSVQPRERAARQGKDANSAPAAQPVKEAPVVVAKIGDYTILRKELEDRVVMALQPREDEFPRPYQPVTVEATLREMLAEKAMSMEGRQLGYLKDEMLRPMLEQFEQQQLARVLLDRQFRAPMEPNQADLDRAQKMNAKWTREQATAAARQIKAMRLFDAYYQGLQHKFHLQKSQDNFAQAGKIYDRLLKQPKEPRGANESWVTDTQIRQDLSEEEKNLVLARYDGGTYTLLDWFRRINDMAPPRRPADLNTAAGVERLLDVALRLPLLVAEAKARGLDKDEMFRHQVRQYEDQQLLYKVQNEKVKGTPEPTAEQIKAYFEKDKERFAQAATVKISQIWCESLEAAQKVKGILADGADFETAKKVHSLQKEQPAFETTAAAEGPFWPELCKTEPNHVVGPLRGFYGGGLKWRMVKVLAKTPAKAREYSEQLANNLKWVLMADQRQKILDDYKAELLKKYPPEIFADRLKGLDPMELATNR